MKCTKCGSELYENARFCTTCGQEVGESLQREQKKENIAKIFCACSFLLLFTGLIVIGIVTKINNKNKTENEIEKDYDLTETQSATERKTERKTEKVTETTTEAWSEGKTNELVLSYITNGKTQCDDCKYTILFGFADEDMNELWVEATVDVKITNDNGELVYSSSFDITEKDYSIWSNVITGEKLLASIPINENALNKGSTKNGTVVLNVTTKAFNLTFEDYSIDTDCLPCNAPSSKCSVELPQLPLTVNEYNWRDEIDTTIRIDSIVSEWDDNYDGTCDLKLTFSGEKTYGDNDYSYISYKLYDSEGYVVDSGVFITDKLSSGDKFKNMDERIYNLEPGTYRLEITDYK